MKSPGRLIDFSHTVEHGMVTYQGLPAPLICDYWSRLESRANYAPGTEFQIGRIEMVGNTGTYLDSPFHRYAQGRDLADLPLESLAHLPAVKVCPWGTLETGNRSLKVTAPMNLPRAGKQDRAIDRSAFTGLNVRGTAVLVHTAWDRHWRTERYFENHPFLTREAAEWLASAGARLVGIDSYNIDDTTDGTRPVHSTLLGAEIPICEHLRGLEQAPAQGFYFYAVPVKVRGFGTFPVRAFGLIEA